MRRPLGLAIFGGLIVSQMLTLFTTPVIYLGFDSLGQRWRRRFGGGSTARDADRDAGDNAGHHAVAKSDPELAP